MVCILVLHPNPRHSAGSERQPKQVTGEKLANPGDLNVGIRSDYLAAQTTPNFALRIKLSQPCLSEHVNQTPSGSDLNSQLPTLPPTPPPNPRPRDSCCCLWHQLSYFSTIFPSDTHIFLSQTRPLCCWDENSR